MHAVMNRQGPYIWLYPRLQKVIVFSRIEMALKIKRTSIIYVQLFTNYIPQVLNYSFLLYANLHMLRSSK